MGGKLANKNLANVTQHGSIKCWVTNCTGDVADYKISSRTQNGHTQAETTYKWQRFTRNLKTVTSGAKMKQLLMVVHRWIGGPIGTAVQKWCANGCMWTDWLGTNRDKCTGAAHWLHCKCSAVQGTMLRIRWVEGHDFDPGFTNRSSIHDVVCRELWQIPYNVS